MEISFNEWKSRLRVYENYNGCSLKTSESLNFRININQCRKRQSKSHSSSKAGNSRVQLIACMNLSKARVIQMGLGYGGLQRKKNIGKGG